MKTTDAFPEPNHTQTPNDFFKMIPDMEEAELRVTLVMIRQTFGFHRDGFKMSLPKLAKATGLSRQGALDGARAAEDRGTFRRSNPDDQGEAEWSLIVTPLYSVEGVQPVEGEPLLSRGQVGVKESIKEKEEREKADAIIFTSLSELTGGGLNSNTSKFVDAWREKHTDDWILRAIDVAKENRARSMKYVDEILITWEAKGYPKTREEKVRERRGNGRSQQPKPPDAAEEERKAKKRAEIAAMFAQEANV